MRNVWIMSVVVVIGLSVGTAAGAQRHVTLTDDQIRAQVEHQLFDAGLVRVTVTVEERTVTLSGVVPSVGAKDEAVRQARKVNDVNEVVSRLEVTRAESDTVLARDVGDVLQRSIFVTVFDDINGTVADGVVTLTGNVTTPYKSDSLARAVAQVQGVRDVVDRIEVLPPSLFDDQLRYAVAQRIYNDPSFLRYSLQHNPPIHIIVRNGRVTLTGVVGSDMDRRMAELKAREVFGVLGVENSLRVGP